MLAKFHARRICRLLPVVIVLLTIGWLCGIEEYRETWAWLSLQEQSYLVRPVAVLEPRRVFPHAMIVVIFGVSAFSASSLVPQSSPDGSHCRDLLMLLPRGNPFLSTGGKYRSEQCHDMKSDMGSSGGAGEVQLNLQELRHAKLGTVAPMIFHWSCALRLRSRIATRSHFIAIRLSGLVTAAHKRMHPIALSYLGGDWRFIRSPCSLVPVPLH